MSHPDLLLSDASQANALPQPFSMRILTADDVPALMALRNDVLGSLPHPDMYVRESNEAEFVRAHIGAVYGRGEGETIGVFDGHRLAAYGMLGLPSEHDTANLGRLLGYAGSQLARVAHLASCMVALPYRGSHLQRSLLVARMQLAYAHGREVCIAMVSPRNHASRVNLMREGLRTDWTGDIDGLRRELMTIDLRASAQVRCAQRYASPKRT